MALSARSGGPGDLVQIVVTHCPDVTGVQNEKPSVFFHDSYGMTKTGAENGQGLRFLPRQQVGDAVRSSYQLGTNDTKGEGLFVAFCGTGTADSSFDVR
jgi:hypothetical protein